MLTNDSYFPQVEYSHKLTEKRRRDRMNISMSEIAQLLPSSSVSKQVRLVMEVQYQKMFEVRWLIG